MAATSLVKSIRVIAAVAIAGVALYAADVATRDCKVGPYLYDNCMWVALRTRLGLPASRLLRMATLESVGIALALLLYLAYRMGFQRRSVKRPQSAGEGSRLAPSQTTGEH